MIESTAKDRRRVQRAIAEIEGDVTQPIFEYRMLELLGDAMTRYLGESIGMSALERWESMGVAEMAILLEALEERSAIVHDGPMLEAEDSAA